MRCNCHYGNLIALKDHDDGRGLLSVYELEQTSFERVKLEYQGAIHCEYELHAETDLTFQ